MGHGEGGEVMGASEESLSKLEAMKKKYDKVGKGVDNRLAWFHNLKARRAECAY